MKEAHMGGERVAISFFIADAAIIKPAFESLLRY